MKMFMERFLLIIFGLLIAMGLTEVALRVVRPLPQKIVINNLNPVRGAEVKPNIEYYAFNDVLEYKTKVKTNSWGLRDDKIDLSNSDKKVILALGDSFTYAHEVDREKTYVEILQRKLSSALKQDIEVINAGVRAYSTAQELLHYKELVKRGLKPDLVMLWFATNDIVDNQCITSDRRKRIDMPCFKLEGNELKLASSPNSIHRTAASARKQKSFVKSLRLYKMIYLKLYHLGMNYPNIILFLNSLGFDLKPSMIPPTIWGWYSEQSSDWWLLTEKLIQELNYEVEKDGGQLMVVLIPRPLQYSQNKQKLLKSTLNIPIVDKFINDPVKPQRLVSVFCQDSKIPVIDLFPGFMSSSVDDNGSSLFFPYDGHLNSEGHALAADIVYKQMMDNKAIENILK